VASRTARLPLAALIALAPLTACASHGPTHSVDVAGKEMQFVPAALNVSAGRVRIRFSNTGTVEHELAILDGDETLSSRTLTPGQSADLDVVTLKAGTTYRMVCREPGHARAGMQGTITVR
jgi:uncharacterized cupredoxin-like copper-binding protein